MQIRIEPLLAAMRRRRDPIGAAEFIDVYSRFVRETLDGSPESGGYRAWIQRAIKRRGGYAGCRRPEDIDIRLRRSRRLIASISGHGVKVPVVIWRDEDGIEVDGWHRTVISWVCGFETVPFHLREGHELPDELKGAVVDSSTPVLSTICAYFCWLTFRAGLSIESLIA